MDKTMVQGRTLEDLLETTHKAIGDLRTEVVILDDLYRSFPAVGENRVVLRWIEDTQHVIYDLQRAREQLERAIEDAKIRREADEYVASAER